MNPSQAHRFRVPLVWALSSLALVVIGFVSYHYLTLPTFGDQLGNRALQLADNTVSANTDYQLSFDLSTAGTLGSIDVQFCANDPIIGDPCTAPAGLDVSGATLASQLGPGSFTISGASTANELILTRPPAAAATGLASFHFTNAINPSSPGSYFVRVQTFASTDASGPASDYGGIAFAIANGLAITAEVPPYLLFCTAVTISNLNCANAVGDYIDFGELSTTHASTGSSQMLVATNAESGYDVTANGPTLTSGTNAITAMAANDVSRPGTGQFGFNLRANNTPADGSDPVERVAQPVASYGLPNSYRFNDGDTIVTNPVPDNVRVFTISYLVNVPAIQAPGVYVTTLTYVCVANF